MAMAVCGGRCSPCSEAGLRVARGIFLPATLYVLAADRQLINVPSQQRLAAGRPWRLPGRPSRRSLAPPCGFARGRPAVRQAEAAAGAAARAAVANGEPRHGGAAVARRTAAAEALLAGATIAGVPATAAAVMTKNGEQPFELLIQRYKPEHPPVRSHSSLAELALARHLTAAGATCYTAWWCPHCQEQRENFGKEAVRLAPFVQCANENGRQIDFCKEKGIGGYPTWVINGEQLSGGRDLSELANLTNFSEFPLDAFSPRGDEDMEYIWGWDEEDGGSEP